MSDSVIDMLSGLISEMVCEFPSRVFEESGIGMRALTQMRATGRADTTLFSADGAYISCKEASVGDRANLLRWGTDASPDLCGIMSSIRLTLDRIGNRSVSAQTEKTAAAITMALKIVLKRAKIDDDSVRVFSDRKHLEFLREMSDKFRRDSIKV